MADDEDLESYWELLRPKPPKAITISVEGRSIGTFLLPFAFQRTSWFRQEVVGVTTTSTMLVPAASAGVTRLIRIVNNSSHTLYAVSMGVSTVLSPYSTWEIPVAYGAIYGYWSGLDSGHALVVYDEHPLENPGYAIPT